MKTLEQTINQPASTPGERAQVARRIAHAMYGDSLYEYPNIPYSEYEEKMFWVLDNHNDWFLQFKEENPQQIVIRHRDPQPRHELILDALKISLRDL